MITYSYLLFSYVRENEEDSLNNKKFLKDLGPMPGDFK
jgi:hypothetical protein